jgi:hypothetical protein
MHWRPQCRANKRWYVPFLRLTSICRVLNKVVDVYKATGKLSRKPVIGCILPHEREAWFDLLKPRPGSDERTLVDVWREKHPDEKKVFS